MAFSRQSGLLRGELTGLSQNHHAIFAKSSLHICKAHLFAENQDFFEKLAGSRQR